MKRPLAEQILTTVSQIMSRGSGGTTDVVLIGEPGVGTLKQDLAAAGARVAIHASADEIPASLNPTAVVDARSAPVDVRIADLLVSLTRLAPSGIYIATASFGDGEDGGSQHLTLFDAIQTIEQFVAGAPGASRGVTVLPRSDGRALELSTSWMDVRAFFEQAVAAIQQRNGLVVVRRSEAATERANSIDVAELPPGPAFEVRRLSRAIGGGALADLALERFDQRVGAEIDILRLRLARRDRDLSELRTAIDVLELRLAQRDRDADVLEVRLAQRDRDADVLEVRLAQRDRDLAELCTALEESRTTRSSDVRDKMKRFERSIRKLWKAPLAALGKSKEKSDR